MTIVMIGIDLGKKAAAWRRSMSAAPSSFVDGCSRQWS